ncbi:MAG: tetratricopeptide repeat protein, partial [Planctomycetota bacterium]
MRVETESRSRERLSAACSPPSPADRALPVLNGSATRVRPSRMSRRRAIVLVAVHLLMLLHVLHWVVAGRTISPIEPSETMYTLRDGRLNAGFIFFALALLATLLTGRFVCGWACHVVAYQDLCAWLLKRIGIHPRPLRTRLLVLAPLMLALYMFVWPVAYMAWFDIERPPLTDHLWTREFWATFPGPVVAVLTLAICGFAIVYFLGAKGFCTFACPYGGFFGVLDRLAPGRIRVTDACAHCGHCTAACSSNVRVHEEVARYGMVVDPGCMKCMDCVSVCPNDALYVGWGRPAVGARPTSPPKTVPYTFTLAEELVMVVVGLAALLAFRGLYDQVPLLLAMGLAALTAYVFMLLMRMVRSANVRLQQFQLKRGGRRTRAGTIFALASVAYLLFTIHSGTVRFAAWSGHRALAASDVDDRVWLPGSDWWAEASDRRRGHVERAIRRLTLADRWGWLPTPSVLTDLTWAFLAKDDLASAERVMRRMVARWPDGAPIRRGLAGVLRRGERYAEAEQAYRQALALDPAYAPARRDLAAMLATLGRTDEAVGVLLDGDAQEEHGSISWRLEAVRLLTDMQRWAEAEALLTDGGRRTLSTLEEWNLAGTLAMQQGKGKKALDAFRRAVELAPDAAEAQYNLGYALLTRAGAQAALPHLRKAVRLDPDNALYRY